MALSKEEIKAAIREAMSYEFRDIPCDDSHIDYEFSDEFDQKMHKLINEQFCDIPCDDSQVDYEFSDEFEQKMQKLIKERKKKSRHLSKKVFRRILLIAAIVSLIFAMLLCITAGSGPGVKFSTKLVDDGRAISYLFEGDITYDVEKEYEMTYIPEGYEQEKYSKTVFGVCTKYVNAEGKSITFRQKPTVYSGGSYDIEHGTTTTIYVLGMKVHLRQRRELSGARWVHDRYFCVISCNGNVEESEVIKMVESVQPVQPTDTADT